MCKENKTDHTYISYVHKLHLYNGYAKVEYQRYFCSKECLDIFEKKFRCNHCHIVTYDDLEYKTGEDGFTYCNDENELTIGDKPCYQILFEKINIRTLFFLFGFLDT
jgi:hypothetical protein